MGSARRRIIVAVIAACMVGLATAGRFKKHPTVEQISLASAVATSIKTGRGGIRDFSTAKECARTCVPGERSKICHYKFVAEYYATLTNACKFCRSNATVRLGDDGCQCITADGYEQSGIITVNRMYPGPAIVVCEGDRVVVDVTNHIHGNEMTLHWHGIQQRGTPYYDGVPYVTQCPISEGTTFRYQWKASSAGTHFWHSHSGYQKTVGLEGPIIIREPKAAEPYNELWDEEDMNHVLFLSDWHHGPGEDRYPGNINRNTGHLADNILINGMGRWKDPATGNTTTSPRAVFTVKPGLRYRFRIITGSSMTCSLLLTIQGHNLTVIASDGEPVKPVTVGSINLFSAERYDFVLHADKKRKPSDFWIQLRAQGLCEARQFNQLAILRYEAHGQATVPPTKEPTFTSALPQGIVLNPLNVRCDNRTQVKNVVCVTQLKSVEPVPPELLKKTTDVKFYLPFGFFNYTGNDAFIPSTYNKFIVGNNRREFASVISNISDVFPPSPLLSQLKDIPRGKICEPGKTPPNCTTKSNPCFCTHVRKIPYGSTVELILVDEAQIERLSHPFHLHGFAFHVFGDGCGDDYGIPSINVDIAKDLDKKGEMVRQWKRPPAKDTFALPYNGFSIIRFVADNPGFWLFHCHFMLHLSDGMSIIFQVGKPEDQPPVPRGFPKCGNFQPPVEI